MFPFVLVCKEESGPRTGCPVGTDRETKQTHQIHLSGWLGELEACLWQCILETSQASLWTALEYLQIQRKRIGPKSPQINSSSSSSSSSSSK